MKKQTKEGNLRKAFLKILKPPCLGKWNCLVDPSPNNLFYKPGKPFTSIHTQDAYSQLARGCPFILECMEAAGIIEPKKALKEWLPPNEFEKLLKYE